MRCLMAIGSGLARKGHERSKKQRWSHTSLGLVNPDEIGIGKVVSGRIIWVLFYSMVDPLRSDEVK